MRYRYTRAVLTGLLLALLLHPAARAQGGDGGLFSRPADTLTDAARSAGSSIAGLWQDLTASVMPPDRLPSQLTDDDRRFFAILEALGLQLTEIDAGKGWMPNTAYRFVASRQATDADLDRGERKLTEYVATGAGLRPRAKQKIARTVLDTVANGGFTIAAMEVVVWPWPDASYQLTARTPALPK